MKGPIFSPIIQIDHSVFRKPGPPDQKTRLIYADKSPKVSKLTLYIKKHLPRLLILGIYLIGPRFLH